MSEIQNRQNVVRSILVKPAGPDCNLACDYCFYLEKSRLFQASRIHRMTDTVLKRTLSQLMMQPSRHFSIGWQGGEPTVVGLAFFHQAIAYQKKFGAGKVVGNSLQTNGLLLDTRWARFLAEYNFLVGLSLDGPASVHDRYRRRRDGKGTFGQVVAAARMLLDHGVMVNALAVVTDVSAALVDDIYAFFKDLGLVHLQFIPATPRTLDARVASEVGVSTEAYAGFLIRLFDLWIQDFDAGRPTVSIRFFEAVLNRYLGAEPSDCTLLETCGRYLVVEHNGDVFPCDFFVDNAHRLGNIMTASLESLYTSPAMQAFGRQKRMLPQACHTCDALGRCRGGCPKDRPPDAPSYYCEAFRRFFDHAQPRLETIARRIKQDTLSRQREQIVAALRDGAVKPGRNDPCPCGSGKKFKKCCQSVLSSSATVEEVS